MVSILNSFISFDILHPPDDHHNEDIYSTTHLKRQSHNAHNKSKTQKSFDTS